MTTENQTTTHSIEETTYSKASALGRNIASKAVDKTTTARKTLSLRPTKSVKRNDSFKPVKKSR